MHRIRDFIVALVGALLIKFLVTLAIAYVVVERLTYLEKPVVKYFDLIFIALLLLPIVYYWNRRRYAAYGFLAAEVIFIWAVS